MSAKFKEIFTTTGLFQLILVTVNAQLIYAFWDIRNTLPQDFPAALGVTDAQAGQLYSMQGLVIILGTVALGWIGDRFPIRVIMAIASAGVGGISLYITLASPGIPFPVLLACFFLMLLCSEVLFKPANFKAVSLSTSAEHQGTAFGLFEFGRGLLAFLISLLWTVMIAISATPFAIMLTASCIVIGAGVAVFFVVPKGTKVGDADTQSASAKEAIRGVGHVAKLPVVWIAGINVFCIYGTFVAAGTYFARYLQAGYGTSAVVAAVFATTVIGLRMLPLVSSILVEKVFKTATRFMRFMEVILAVILAVIGVIFITNPATVTEFSADNAPDNIVSTGIFWTLVVLMLLASAITFMVRGVYYAPIGEFNVPKRHASAAMSFAITLGYIPALVAPIVLSNVIVPSVKNDVGEIVTQVLTPTSSLGGVFFGLAVLAIVAAVLSHIMVRMHQKMEDNHVGA
ncbi:Nitrate/nitrite transporter NarK [Arcanobacterium phocae]|uniref:Nitrate/nitrite transporter NarK n=1 Tax=Arcanobacterium phocae TaxID=131112 RepID=A0A1H2LBH5_9ACTO|nr:MFS transporter [Arcanobacterium phocae]SDU78279.1 Nitrate/nitrite transporter NarK [Arcanobacterium phocae]